MKVKTVNAFLMMTMVGVLAAAVPAAATPLLVSTFNATDRFDVHSLASLPQGDFVQVAAGLLGASTSDPFASLTVTAVQGGSQALTFFPFTAPIIVDPTYLAFIPFLGAPTGSWSITATDTTGPSLAMLSPAIANPQLVPYVTGISVSDQSTTPTVSWTLPGLAGFDVDQARIRVIDAVSEVQLFQQVLPTAVTSFVIPPALLTPGGSYVYRVSLEDLELDTFGLHVENRSNAFSNVSAVPEPGVLTLMIGSMGAALARWRRRR